MNDQASTLRVMATATKNMTETQTLNTVKDAKKTAKQTRSIAITGGKGGVGKSNLAINLALELGKIGNTVSLLDADFGLANIDLLCGVSPKFHLGHVISSHKDLEDIKIDISEKVSLIP